MTDEALGIDAGLVQRALFAFSIPPSARVSPASSQGTFHRLFDVDAGAGGECVLRIAAMSGEPAASLMRLESRVMSALRARELPVPACEFRSIPEGGTTRGAHCMAWARGASLTSLDADEPRMLVALSSVGRFLARLHEVPAGGYGPLSLAKWRDGGFEGVHASWDEYVFLRLDEHVEACARMGAVSAQEASAIGAAFERDRPLLAGTRSALLHGDPGSHNFIMGDDGVHAVLDWEDALAGDPLFDLASLCTFHPERRHEAIFSAYGAAMPRGSGEWRRFWLYFLRISLAKTVHRHRFGYADRPDRAPASRRIQLALERLREG